MEPTTKTDRQTLESITEILLVHFGEALVLDRKETHFLSSTFSVTSLTELENLAHPDRSDELGLFLEMVLAPSLTIRKKIEPFVWDAVFSDDQERRLRQAVENAVTRISFTFQGQNDTATLSVPSAFLGNYVKKLRLTRSIPSALLWRMDACLTLPLKVETCVKLRISDITFDEPNMDFLSIFIGESRCFKGDYSAHLDFALSMMNLSGLHNRLEETLIQSLRRFLKIRNQIRDAGDMMKKNSMEALMMKGFVVPPQSQEDIDTRIALARRILACVYGRVDTEENTVSEIDLGHHSDGESLERIIRLLS